MEKHVILSSATHQKYAEPLYAHIEAYTTQLNRVPP